MLHTCAVKLVDQIFLHCALPTEKRAIYIYGVELGCSTLWTCTFILLLSFLLGQALNCILFLGVFISLRLFAGGYHAETYRNCFILTTCTCFATIGLSWILVNQKGSFFHYFILAFSLFLIWIFTPIRNHHHPLTETSYRRNKRISRMLAAVEAAVTLLLYLVSGNSQFLSIVTASFAAVAVMMIIPKIQERGV